jgi:hypothetical protein
MRLKYDTQPFVTLGKRKKEKRKKEKKEKRKKKTILN